MRWSFFIVMKDVCYVYALWSDVVQKVYVGFSRNPDKRLIAHNSGKSKWTKGKGPWKRFYLKSFTNEAEALSHENYLKSGWGRKGLLKTLESWKDDKTDEVL